MHAIRGEEARTVINAWKDSTIYAKLVSQEHKTVTTTWSGKATRPGAYAVAGCVV